MGPQPSPWFYARKKAWFVTHHGKQVRLTPANGTRDQAQKAFYKLMASEQTPRSEAILVVQVCDLFLEWSRQHHKPATFEWCQDFLESFCNHKGTGRLKACEVKPFHLTRWVDSHPKWTGAIRSSQQIVKRAFSWAKREGLIADNPFADVRLPPIRARERLLSEAEQAEILAMVSDASFRNFLIALQESGCRPSEVAKVTTNDVNLELGVWVFVQHKTAKKTGKARVIYLSPRLLALTKEMMLEHPTGPLFPNRKGGMFNRNAIRCRFRRMEKKLPHLGRVQAYLYRHQYATAALERGVGVAQVAELLGHTSTDMVMKHYGKLSQRTAHLREMAAKATAARPQDAA